MNAVYPFSMTSTKVDDKGLVNLPIRKDGVAFPILNVFLRPVDNATSKVLNRLVFGTNSSLVRALTKS